MQEYIRITPNTVSSNTKFVYIIFVDGIECGYCNKAENAKILMDDIATQLEDELREPRKSVSRQTIGDNTIKITTQRHGTLVDGSVRLKHTLTYRSVPKYSRLQRPPTPPPPPPSFLE